MFGMGWQEILMILVIAVLVIGPEQLPQVARGLGKVMAQFRRATNDLRDQVNREFSQDENFREFKEFHQSINSEVRGLGQMAQDYVEKEVAKEEAELTRLETDMKEAAGEAMQAAGEAKKAAEPSQWLPPAEPAPEPAADVETVTVAPEPAADAEPAAEDEKPAASDTRKETA